MTSRPRPLVVDGQGIDMRPFSRSLPMALLKAREATMRLFRPLLAEHDLTEQQWRVLRALAAASTPLSVGELADHTFLLAPSLSRILSNLEGRLLIERQVAEHDQRRSHIALSKQGRDLVQQIAPQSEALYNRIEQHFGFARLDDLLGELNQLASLDAGEETIEQAS
ncbi:MAG: homoprotocatechuate degradation operon regulator HpaR [Acidimicrobiales bacterium]